MAKRTKIFYSTLICPYCAQRMTIPRPTARLRPKGHIKTMYCAQCKQDRDFIELNYLSLDDVQKIKEGTYFEQQ